jgi:S-adenosylmethionine decarboxylase
MRGLHLTADLYGCAHGTAALTQAATLRALCLEAVHAAALRPVGELFHSFTAAAPVTAEPQGVTGVVLLAESHLTVHTWPERGAVTLDVYVCNDAADHSQAAEQVLAALIEAFAPAQAQRGRLLRGTLPKCGAGAQAGEMHA